MREQLSDKTPLLATLLCLFARQNMRRERGCFPAPQKTMTKKEPKEKGKCGVPEGYLGVADVQKLLNKCRATIWKMVNEGRLPKPLRDGKLRIWDEKEIRMWISNAKFCKKW
jgi:predicted DNA-binding transcriptional regulator AlpA